MSTPAAARFETPEQISQYRELITGAVGAAHDLVTSVREQVSQSVSTLQQSHVNNVNRVSSSIRQRATEGIAAGGAAANSVIQGLHDRVQAQVSQAGSLVSIVSQQITHQARKAKSPGLTQRIRPGYSAVSVPGCSYTVTCTLNWPHSPPTDYDLYVANDDAGVVCYYNDLHVDSLTLNHDAYPICATGPDSPEITTGVFTGPVNLRAWWNNYDPTCGNVGGVTSEVSVSNTGSVPITVVTGEAGSPPVTINPGQTQAVAGDIIFDSATGNQSTYTGGMPIKVTCGASVDGGGVGGGVSQFGCNSMSWTAGDGLGETEGYYLACNCSLSQWLTVIGPLPTPQQWGSRVDAGYLVAGPFDTLDSARIYAQGILSGQSTASVIAQQTCICLCSGQSPAQCCAGLGQTTIQYWAVCGPPPSNTISCMQSQTQPANSISPAFALASDCAAWIQSNPNACQLSGGGGGGGGQCCPTCGNQTCNCPPPVVNVNCGPGTTNISNVWNTTNNTITDTVNNIRNVVNNINRTNIDNSRKTINEYIDAITNTIDSFNTTVNSGGGSSSGGNGQQQRTGQITINSDGSFNYKLGPDDERAAQLDRWLNDTVDDIIADFKSADATGYEPDYVFNSDPTEFDPYSELPLT